MDYDPRRLTPRRRQHWGVEPDPELDRSLDPQATGEYEVIDRRRLLWRDSATILAGVVIALLAAQLIFPRTTGTGTSPGSDVPSALPISSSPRSGSPLPGGSTFGPILDPSLGIDAPPTRIPLVTLPPTGSHAPGATPGPTPRVTPRPTKTPQPPAPTQPPTPTESPAPPPPPTEPPPPPPTEPPPPPPTEPPPPPPTEPSSIEPPAP
jgi:hypothetical protein